MGTTEIIICVIGGFAAGIINTMSGFGSIITLAIYMDILSIPGHIANATNRVNVLSSASISTVTFHRKGKLVISDSKRIIYLVFIGAIAGTILATLVSADQFKVAFKYLLIPVFFILIMNPKRFMTPDTTRTDEKRWLTSILYFLVGIYAGFIQAGFGVLFLMVIVMMSHYDLVKANGLKLFILAIFTVLSLIIFQLNGMIFWKEGLVMSSGQLFGGFLAARLMVKYENASKWAYYFLIVIILMVIIHNFQLWQLFTG